MQKLHPLDTFEVGVRIEAEAEVGLGLAVYDFCFLAFDLSFFLAEDFLCMAGISLLLDLDCLTTFESFSFLAIF